MQEYEYLQKFRDIDSEIARLYDQILELTRQRDALPAAREPGMVEYLERTLAERRKSKPEDVPYLEGLLAQYRGEHEKLAELDRQIRQLRERREQLLEQKCKLAVEYEQFLLSQREKQPSGTVLRVESIPSAEAVGRPGT